METGGNGVNGAHALRPVSRADTPEAVNAIHRLQSMAGRNAMATPGKLKFVTKISTVQVIQNSKFMESTLSSFNSSSRVVASLPVSNLGKALPDRANKNNNNNNNNNNNDKIWIYLFL